MPLSPTSRPARPRAPLRAAPVGVVAGAGPQTAWPRERSVAAPAPPRRSGPAGGRWLRALVALAALVLLAGLLRGADFGPLRAAAAALPAAGWAAAVAGLLGSYGLRAWRLQREWRAVRTVPWADCLRLVLRHNAAVLLLPLRGGEAGYVWLVHRRWGVPWREAARSLLWLRLQDAFVLSVLALALLPPWPLPARVLLATAWCLAAFAAAPALLHRAAGARWRPLARLGGWALALVAGRDDAFGWWCSAANWLLKLAALGGLLAALTGLPTGLGWRAALGGELAGAQPLQGPAGLGSYEAGVWAAAHRPGQAGTALVAAALAVHGLALAVALAAAGLSLLPLGRAAPSTRPGGPPPPAPPPPT